MEAVHDVAVGVWSAGRRLARAADRGAAGDRRVASVARQAEADGLAVHLAATSVGTAVVTAAVVTVRHCRAKGQM